MGIEARAAEAILHEHSYRPIEGRVLLIGRQTVNLDAQELADMLALFSIRQRDETILSDVSTQHYVGRDIDKISDVSFFRSFADCEVSAIDISDYEGAEIVHDLNTPVPDALIGQFDFIYDGSCLDNIFDPVRTLVNISAMLRPGGRVLLHNATNSIPTAYLKFSPDWFIDYFALNDYADCKTYIVERPADGGVRLWHYDPLVIYSGQKGYQCSSIESLYRQWVICVAEKGEASGSDRIPVQMHYRGGDTAQYVAAAERFRASPRPLFSRPGVPPPQLAENISSWATLTPVAAWSETQAVIPPRPDQPQPLARPLVVPPWPPSPASSLAQTRTIDLAREIGRRLKSKLVR